MNSKRWMTLAGIVLALLAIALIVPATFAQIDTADPPRKGGPCDGPPRLLDVAAETLEMSIDDLIAELDEDTSIADVAAARGVAAETIVDAMVDEAAAHMQQAVEDGRLTQEEADERLAQLREDITTRINEPGLPERPPHPPHEGGPREGGPPRGECGGPGTGSDA